MTTTKLQNGLNDKPYELYNYITGNTLLLGSKEGCRKRFAELPDKQYIVVKYHGIWPPEINKDKK